MEAGRRIIKQESARNDLVASGRITFPPTHCYHLGAAMLLSRTEARREKDRAGGAEGGKFVGAIRTGEPALAAEQGNCMGPSISLPPEHGGKLSRREKRRRRKRKPYSPHPRSFHPQTIMLMNYRRAIPVPIWRFETSSARCTRTRLQCLTLATSRRYGLVFVSP